MRYACLNQAQQKCLNESILKTMMRIEESFTELARLGDQKKCLVVCDRGAMDPSACEYRDREMEGGRECVRKRVISMQLSF